MSNYYQPVTSEFKVGLQVQKYKPFQLKWDKITISEDDFRSDLGNNTQNEYTNYLQFPDLYRVKILDKEDIEDFEFKFVKTLKSKKYPYPIDVFKDTTSNWYLAKYDNSLIVKILSYSNNSIKKLKYIDDVGQTIFIGNIKNKSELEELFDKFK